MRQQRAMGINAEKSSGKRDRKKREKNFITIQMVTEERSGERTSEVRERCIWVS